MDIVCCPFQDGNDLTSSDLLSLFRPHRSPVLPLLSWGEGAANIEFKLAGRSWIHLPLRLDSSCSQVPIPSWIFQENDLQELIRMNLESFDLQSVIGKGKFGLVYYAQHKTTSKFLAIKFISKKILYETKSRERTQQVREMNIAHGSLRGYRKSISSRWLAIHSLLPSLVDLRSLLIPFLELFIIFSVLGQFL